MAGEVKESEPTVVKSISLGSLTISVEGLRRMADYLEKKLREEDQGKDVIRQHYIVRYSNGMKTIGVEIDGKVKDWHSTSEKSEIIGSIPTQKDTGTSTSKKTTSVSSQQEPEKPE